MKKLLSSFILLCAILLTFAGCGGHNYDENWIIGKSSSEIVTQYGKFDCTLMPIDTDGLYRNCRCGYTIKEPKVGFLGTSPEELFFIHFDENGIAYECSQGYRPGG